MPTRRSRSSSSRARPPSRPRPGDVPVGPDAAIRFVPAEWHHGYTDGDERVRVVAVGAPADASETEVRRHCPNCAERRAVRIERLEGGVETVHLDCGTVTAGYGD